MNQYIYPAIFYKDEDSYKAIFPDLDLCAEGKNMTEAYVVAQDMLRMYFTYILKYDLDYNTPSTFQKVQDQASKEEVVMFVDAVVDSRKIKKA